MGSRAMCVAAPSNPGTDPLYKDPTAPPAYDEHDTTSQTAEQSTINTKDSKVQRLIQTLDLEYEIAADLLETEGTDIVVSRTTVGPCNRHHTCLGVQKYAHGGMSCSTHFADS